MKRGILLASLIVMLVLGVYSVKEWAPIMAIAGNSMEPELRQGDAIVIQKVLPDEVAVGSVIVFKVHPLIQQSYHYPELVAHRVTEITAFQGNLAFRTKGDNSTDDPFVVPAYDLRGEVSGHLPYVGYLLLFMQSGQGRLFMVIALVLVFLYLYGNELGRARCRVRQEIFAPVIEGNRQGMEVLERRVQAAERALDGFASAMEQYAQHLKSHTSAIIGLSEASHELKRSAQQQNEVLARLAEAIETIKSGNVLNLYASCHQISQEFDGEEVTGMVRGESVQGINASLLNKVFHVYRQHYQENNRLWQLKGLPRLEELKNSFLSELKRQGPSEYLVLQTAGNGQANVGHLLDATIVKAYIAGHMCGKGWISRQELENVNLYLGNTIAQEINVGIKGCTITSSAFVSSLMVVSTLGADDACVGQGAAQSAPMS